MSRRLGGERQIRWDWPPIGQLAEELGVSKKYVDQWVEKKAKTNVDLVVFGSSKKAGTRISPILADSLRGEIRKRKAWITVTDLAKEIGMDVKTVKKIVELAQLTSPDLVLVENHGDYNRLRVAPELESQVRIHGQKRREWITIKELRRDSGTGIDTETLKEIIDDLSRAHPEQIYRSKEDGSAQTHLHPQLADEVRQEIKKRKTWKPLDHLTKDLKTSYRLMHLVLEPLRVAHPEWVIELGGEKKKFIKIHPELEKLIRSQFDKLMNWKPLYALIKDLDTSQRPLLDVVKSLRAQYPDSFFEFTANGVTRTRINPELIPLIKDIIQERKNQKDPEKVSMEVVRKYADDLTKIFFERADLSGQPFASFIEGVRNACPDEKTLRKFLGKED